MKNHSPLLTLAAASALVTAVLTACVTVNVNFPESAVQKAADDYVRDLYRQKEKGKAPAAEASKTPSTEPTQSRNHGFPPLLNSAWAEELSFKVDSSKALQLREKMAARIDEIVQQKKAGVLGESADGLLSIHDPASVKPLFLKKIEKLVKDDNEDREALYAEVLAANRMPKGRLKDLRRNFARSFQSQSPAGTWIQSEEGGWTRK